MKSKQRKGLVARRENGPIQPQDVDRTALCKTSWLFTGRTNPDPTDHHPALPFKAFPSTPTACSPSIWCATTRDSLLHIAHTHAEILIDKNVKQLF